MKTNDSEKDIIIKNLTDKVVLLKQQLSVEKKKIASAEFLKNEYKVLYNNIPAGVMHYDTNGIILDCNDNFIEIIGSSRELLIGLDMYNRIPDKKLLSALKLSLTSGFGEYKDTYKSITAKKETPIKVLFNCIKNDDNEIIGGICIAEDLTESIKKQKDLNVSEENYKLIFENTTDVYYRTDVDGTILAISPAVIELLLVENIDVLIGSNVSNLYYNQSDRVLLLEELKTNGKVNEYRIVLRKTDGSPITVEFNSKLIYNSKGEIDSIVGVFYDVTPRIEAEYEKSTNIWFFEMLRNIEKLIRTSTGNDQLFKGITSNVVNYFKCDTALILSYKGQHNATWKTEAYALSENNNCNKETDGSVEDLANSDEVFDRVLMYKTHVVIDKNNISELSKVSEQIGVKAQMIASVNLNSGNSLVFCLNHCKNDRVWNKYEKALFAEMTNRLTDAINTFESTDLLLKSEEHHRLLIEATTEGYWEINKEGISTVANNAMCQMLGFEIDEFIGKSATIFATSSSRQTLIDVLFSNEGDSTSSFEMELRHKNGEKIHTLFNVTKRFDKDNNHTGTFFFVTNITKQKEALDKAKESDHLKSVFIKNISHEVRTPLNGIIGFLGMLGEDDISSAERQEYIKYVMDSSNQLTSVITDILEFSQLESKQIDTSYSSFNLNYLLDEIHEQFSPFIESKNKSHLQFFVEKSLNDDDCSIYTDKSKIKQVLLYIINNAIKYTDKGEVKFGYEINDATIQFFISDTGIGIPDCDKEIIFDKFRNGSITNNPIYGGNGLGLTISKSIIELLGGSVWFESKLSVGTTFYVKIPIQKSDDASEKKYVAPQIKSNYNWENKTVLIVDDVYEVYKLISVYVRSQNANYIYAKSGKQAIDMFVQNPNIDIVLLDIQLPDIDGYQVFKKLKSLNPKIPIIAQTAFALSDDKDKVMTAGFDGYITKPIYRNTLINLVAKFLND